MRCFSRAIIILFNVYITQIQCLREKDAAVCLGGNMLDKQTNSCVPCPPGYFEINCAKPCPAGNYGDGCQSLCPQACRNTCDITTGECLQLPKRICPSENDGINCTEPCPVGHDGDGCQSICPQACRNACDTTIGECLQLRNGSEPTIIETKSQSHAGPQRKYFSNSIIVIILGSVFVFILITVLIYYVQKILRHTLLRKSQGQLRISLSLTEDTIYQQINENILST